MPGGLTTTEDGSTYTISGTPQDGTEGTYTATVTAANGAGSQVTTLNIIVWTTPAFEVSTVEYTATEAQEITPQIITPTKGLKNTLTWTVASGQLPSGLTGRVISNDKSYSITGTPAAGSMNVDPGYSYVVTASNAAGQASVTFAIKVGRSAQDTQKLVEDALDEILNNTGGESTSFSELLDKLGDLDTITTITIPQGISDLNGLEALTNLKELNLQEATSLTDGAVDFSDPRFDKLNLEKVDMTGNATIKTIKLGANTNIKKIEAAGCSEITEIAIAGNKNIEQLTLSDARGLTEINAEGCENLEVLVFENCGVADINLKSCINIKELKFPGNSVKFINADYFKKLASSDFDATGQTVGNTSMTNPFDIKNWAAETSKFATSSFKDSDEAVTISEEDEYDPNLDTSKVVDVKAYDEKDNPITVNSYNKETGEASFASTPAKIVYYYDTDRGNMDVEVSGASQEAVLGSSSSSGGCSAGFASGAVLVLLAFALMKKR